MHEPDVANLEEEVARTAALVIHAAALADRMARGPTTSTLSDNLRRLRAAVDRGRVHVQQLSRAEGSPH